MSSVHTVQTVMNQLNPREMSGTVMAVADVSCPAMEGMQRRWPNQGRGIDLIDMNREWPGNENGATAPSRHAALLFNRLPRRERSPEVRHEKGQVPAGRLFNNFLKSTNYGNRKRDGFSITILVLGEVDLAVP